MTRRCSVIRIPVAAQRASMPEGCGAEDGFRAVIGISLLGAFLPLRTADLKPLVVAGRKFAARSQVTPSRCLRVVPKCGRDPTKEGGGTQAYDKSRRIRSAFNCSPLACR